MKRNPFKATIGKTPPVLVGRNDVIQSFVDALDNGPGTHERISVVTGPRGIGKTVLLNAFEDKALEKGWLYFSETATKGFIDRLKESVQCRYEELSQGSHHVLTGFSIAGLGGANWQKEKVPGNNNLRILLERLLKVVDERDKRLNQETGVLITLDELHHSQHDEIVELATVVQHLVREENNISLVMAGIPSSVNPLLSDADGTNPITFLRRANRISLGRIEDSYVKEGLQTPVEELDMLWDVDGLKEAVSACGGYPFMIQLVGQFSFAARAKESKVITCENARIGIAEARRKMGNLVHEPALADLSDVDRTYLLEMSRDPRVSQTSAIAERMKVSPQYANTYRRRLIEAEMIEEAGYGKVRFALPYLREYLREHYVSEINEYTL